MQKTVVEARRFQTKREKLLKKDLIALLKDDGRGHYHAKYAERLEKFDIVIVYRSEDPMFTAAISFETGIIYIGEGFLTIPEDFYQLNVLLRHEISHNAMMHEMRMLRELGKDVYDKLARSVSFHELLNILMDDEISNKRYSNDDKETVRKMRLNGKLVGGLVTEDHRAQWQNLSLEEMYNKATEEIELLQKTLLDLNAPQSMAAATAPDTISHGEIGVLKYADRVTPSIFSKLDKSMNDFIKSGCKVPVKNGKKIEMAKEYSDIIKSIVENIEENDYTEADIKSLLEDVVTASPTKILDLISPLTGEILCTVTSPEEKYIAANAIKACLEEYQAWYKKVADTLMKGNYTADQIKELLNV